MRDALVVEQAGFATFQDLGRRGRGLSGVSRNGAADGVSARVANILVGNPDDAPLIEVTGSSLQAVVRSRILFTVTGAATHVELDGAPTAAGQPLVAEPGSRLVVPAPRRGMRSYLAINGMLRAPRVLGSAAPDLMLDHPARLGPGQVVEVDSGFEAVDHPHFRLPLFRLDAPRAALASTSSVDVTTGPDADQFDRGLEELPAGFEVSPNSDHIGLRLTGTVPTRSTTTEILSRGVPVGAVEVPPGGGLLLLLRGRLVTAGYPVVAVVTTAALDALGQARPGDTLHFRRRTVAEAVRALRRREAVIDELRRRVATVFRLSGIGHLMPVEPELAPVPHVTATSAPVPSNR